MIFKTDSAHRLIRKCKKQNRKAQLEVYQKYCTSMFHVANRIVNHTETAEEVMQDAFISAFEKIDQFDETKGVFGAWLKRIVINKSISYLRKEKDIQFKRLEDISEVVDDDEPNLELISSDEYEQFKRTFGKLKENYQVVLTLHYMEGYDLQEIGEILNISYANTRTMLTRAKQSLKKKVEA